MDVKTLSSRYAVRRLGAPDVEAVYELCAQNPLYYQHCPPFVTKESILEDMKALPPGKCAEDKYFLGFFDENVLVAVLDLVLRYPDVQTAYIGFFMMRNSMQGRGEGSAMITQCLRVLGKQGFLRVRLGYVKGNLQSQTFWRKNGFQDIGTQVDFGQYSVVVAQRVLSFMQ